MSATYDPDVQDWIDRARSSSDILALAQARGAVLKRSGGEWMGPCPVCGGTDRFSINERDRVFNCRGAEGGSAIDMVMHLDGVSLMGACEIINGEPPPGRDSNVVPLDPAIVKERREERKDRDLSRADAEDQERRDRRARCAVIFDSCRRLIGTDGEAYFRRRKITMTDDLSFDIRFAPSLEYWGYPENEDKQRCLGEFPCVVAAIRALDDTIIGIHRTYLDVREPKKLEPPGDRRRNAAKKVFGEWMGGAIRMSPVRAAMASGEGIETCASWWQLGVGPDDIGLWCAVALRNLSGGSTGMLPHPRPSGNIKTIQNGVPDMREPGILLPPEVHSVYLLGDGDSDMHATHAALLTGARRHRAEGREVFVHFSPNGLDFNDLIMGREPRRAA